jgi:hypothetical protein
VKYPALESPGEAKLNVKVDPDVLGVGVVRVTNTVPIG